MAGIGDSLRNAIESIVPGDAARKVSSALGDGHTTSGLDAAMQAHADKMHPTDGSAPPQITRNKDGSLHFPLDD